jgi:hypothetical protein
MCSVCIGLKCELMNVEIGERSIQDGLAKSRRQTVIRGKWTLAQTEPVDRENARDVEHESGMDKQRLTLRCDALSRSST